MAPHFNAARKSMLQGNKFFKSLGYALFDVSESGDSQRNVSCSIVKVETRGHFRDSRFTIVSIYKSGGNPLYKIKSQGYCFQDATGAGETAELVVIFLKKRR